MGSLILPAAGVIYADTQIFVDSVENHPNYAPVLRPLWQNVQARRLEVVSSQGRVQEVARGWWLVVGGWWLVHPNGEFSARLCVLTFPGLWPLASDPYPEPWPTHNQRNESGTCRNRVAA